jgi:hypothetical protein
VLPAQAARSSASPHDRKTAPGPRRPRALAQVNPNIRRDKWTDEEDSQLVDLVKTFGIGKWAEIARHMVGRTDQQCMGRWRRHLDPSIRRVSAAAARQGAAACCRHRRCEGAGWAPPLARVAPAPPARCRLACRPR